MTLRHTHSANRLHRSGLTLLELLTTIGIFSLILLIIGGFFIAAIMLAIT